MASPEARSGLRQPPSSGPAARTSKKPPGRRHVSRGVSKRGPAILNQHRRSSSWARRLSTSTSRRPRPRSITGVHTTRPLDACSTASHPPHSRLIAASRGVFYGAEAPVAASSGQEARGRPWRAAWRAMMRPGEVPCSQTRCVVCTPGLLHEPRGRHQAHVRLQDQVARPRPGARAHRAQGQLRERLGLYSGSGTGAPSRGSSP